MDVQPHPEPALQPSEEQLRQQLPRKRISEEGDPQVPFHGPITPPNHQLEHQQSVQ